MLFSSWQFIFVFLPLAVAGFFAIPARAQVARKWWLLATSLVFYAYWKVEYVPLLLFSIGFNYAIAEGITRGKRERTSSVQNPDGAPSDIGRLTLDVGRWTFLLRPRALLAIGVAVNLLLLGYYKYTNFILDAFGRVSGHAPVRLDIALPLAISFFTFTQIGYLVDVFRDQRLHYRPLDYSVFVVFFPHLIAGPIVRHWEIIPQFADKELKANRTDMAAGIAIFLLGLFKRCCSRIRRRALPISCTVLPRRGRRSHGSTRGSARSGMRCRSTSISPDTRTWPSALRGCLA